jgi:hypothetical protein
MRAKAKIWHKWAAAALSGLLGSATFAQDLPAAPLSEPITSTQHAAATADFGGQPASSDARYVADWIVDSRDNEGLPFAVVDKKGARIFIFGADGRLKGSTQALLGSATGDYSVPDLNKRNLARLAAYERTTPAGRFNAQPGYNLKGEDIIWVDYNAALAIHRLRPAPAQERRAERMASASPDDNRISLGCVVVPVAFYDNTVSPVLGKSRSVVYILPETRPVREMFGWQ